MLSDQSWGAGHDQSWGAGHILDLCAKKNPGARDNGVQITLVAGAGFVQERTDLELRKAV